MADKITGTNASPNPSMIGIEPDEPKVQAPKTETPAAEVKEEQGYFDSMLDGVKNRATDYAERLTGKVDRLVNADGVLETVDAAADLARSTPIGIFPHASTLNDLTSAAIELRENLVAEGKSVFDLVGDVPGAIERVIDNSNTLLEQVLGEDAPKIAKSLDEVCWETTAEMAFGSGGLEKAQLVGMALVTEVLVENNANIEAVLNSKTAEHFGDVAEVAAKIANFGLVGIFPPMIFLAATGNGPATLALEYAKETIDSLSKPENMRAIYQVGNGPAVSDIANMKPGGFYEVEETMKVKVAAGKGGEVSIKVKKTIECLDDGSFDVKFKVDSKVAAALGLQAGKGVSLSGGINPEFNMTLNVDDPAIAAKLVRGDRADVLLHMMGNPGDLEKVAFKQEHFIEAEVTDVFEKKFSGGVEADLIGLSVEAGFEIEGAAKVFQKVPVSVLMREQPELNDAMDVFQVMTQPGLSVGAEVQVSGKIALDADGPKFKFEAKGEIKRSTEKLEAEMTVEVDILKAAKHLSMTPAKLQEHLENGTLNPMTFWQSLPLDAVSADVKFESSIYSKQLGVDLKVTSRKAGLGEKKEVSGTEMMGIIREFEAGDLRKMAGIRA